jgi:hypothetical protein
MSRRSLRCACRQREVAGLVLGARPAPVALDERQAEGLAVEGGNRVEVLRWDADEVHTGDEGGRIGHDGLDPRRPADSSVEDEPKTEMTTISPSANSLLLFSEKGHSVALVADCWIGV